MDGINLIKADVCSPDDSVAAVAKSMQKKKARRMFVVDKEGKLLGVVTTVDIVNKIVAGGKDSKKTHVHQIMTKKVSSIGVNDSLDDCLKIMNRLKTFVCPVVDKGKLLGVVAYQNIIASVVVSSRR